MTLNHDGRISGIVTKDGMIPADRARISARAVAGGYNSVAPIELRHLRYILASAEYGSFRQGAHALGIQASALSRRIGDLEDQLGVRIFVRHHGGVRLTTEGKQLAQRARAIMDRMERMLTAHRRRAPAKAGYELHILVHPASGQDQTANCAEALRIAPEPEISKAPLKGVFCENQWNVIRKALCFNREQMAELLVAAVYGAACRTLLGEGRLSLDEKVAARCRIERPALPDVAR